MSLVLLSLIASVSSAADLNQDGCEDAYFDANSACVSSSATLGSGVTVGTDAVVGNFASVGTDTALAATTYVGSHATLVGRVSEPTARPVGSGTVIGRRAYIDADHDIGADNTIGRAVTAGLRLQTQSNVAIGYATTLGDDVTINSGAVVGNLVGLGDNTTLQASAVLARGVSILDSTGTGLIGGIICPNVSIGADNDIAVTARIRRNATLGNDVTIEAGVRIAQDAIIGDGVTIGANAIIGAGAEVTATTVVAPGAVIGRSEVFDDPAIVSQHNTVAFNPSITSGGCSYAGTHAILYENIGSMDWRSCMGAAAERGASVSSNAYTSTGGSGGTNGWTGHRNGGSAMYATWSSYSSAGITTSRACVLSRDPRSSGNSAPLNSTITYDGDVWNYQDYGSQYYDQCILLASNAGASIITPYTLGLSGDSYWVPSVHTCNTYEYITSSGNSYTYENTSSGARSSTKGCMVGYLSQQAP
jgi:UDP-3-O-[3-hydroxymyristoyl] glucosamine N-acyltransferase